MDEKHLLELMEHHGVKPTANRIVIARALAAAGRPMSMTELETVVETIDKSNIFRTLQAFREAHLVHVLDDSGDGVRYELCPATAIMMTRTMMSTSTSTAKSATAPSAWKTPPSLRFPSRKVLKPGRLIIF